MRVLPAAVTAIAVIWLVALLAAPSALARGRFPVATFVVYEAGSHICHQRRERSFEWSGTQMPVCARCLGLYVAGALGALAALLIGSKPGAVLPARRTLAIAAVPMILSLALEWTGVSNGSNITRLVSGLPVGGVLGSLLVRELRGGR
jgi:uncharacterized membrane protein